jgi:hypothetical protein
LRPTRAGLSLGSLVAILCAACFLAVAQGAVTHAFAAEKWETWPPQKVEPGVSPPPAETGAAAKAGEAAGAKTSAGISAGTIGWIALGLAVVGGIAAAAGGGGGTTSNH